MSETSQSLSGEGIFSKEGNKSLLKKIIGWGIAAVGAVVFLNLFVGKTSELLGL